MLTQEIGLFILSVFMLKVDLYPLMCHILHLPTCHPHNGSMDEIQKLLRVDELAEHNAYVTLITCKLLCLYLNLHQSQTISLFNVCHKVLAKFTAC